MVNNFILHLCKSDKMLIFDIYITLFVDKSEYLSKYYEYRLI